MAKIDSIDSTERVRGVVEYDLGLHFVLDALVDVHPDCGGFVILYFPFFDCDSRVTMLLHSFKSSSQCLVSVFELLWVIVDPMVHAGT
jgi:hypothetical protein